MEGRYKPKRAAPGVTAERSLRAPRTFSTQPKQARTADYWEGVLNMTSWLIVLKYTGGFFAAFYGVYATLTDFRVKRNGKRVLSSKGYFGIGLLTLSAILGLSSDGLKDLKEKLERDEAAKVERISREQAQARDERIT